MQFSYTHMVWPYIHACMHASVYMYLMLIKIPRAACAVCISERHSNIETRRKNPQSKTVNDRDWVCACVYKLQQTDAIELHDKSASTFRNWHFDSKINGFCISRVHPSIYICKILSIFGKLSTCKSILMDNLFFCYQNDAFFFKWKELHQYFQLFEPLPLWWKKNTWVFLSSEEKRY